MVECAHGNAAPDHVVAQLSECQAGAGRHKCAVCAFAAGQSVTQGSEFSGPVQECDQGHAAAPVDMLHDLPVSQAGPHRHRCAYEAYQRGKAAGIVAILEEGDKNDIDRDEDERLKIHQITNDPSISETEKAQLLLARRGQSLFRRRVIEICQRCVLSGLGNPQFSVASHIKPWRLSSNVERLDGHNGVLLAPHLDHLFDKGWISIKDDGEVLISSHLDQRVISFWHVDTLTAAGRLSNKHSAYLEFHRGEIFKT